MSLPPKSDVRVIDVGQAGEAEFRFLFCAMASDCEVHVAGRSLVDARRAAESAIAEVLRIEAKYSRYRDDSIVSLINRAAGTGERVTVDDETAGLLDFAASLHALSDGLFDITSGVLRRVWDFRSGRVPEPARLAEAVALIGWNRVVWDRPGIALPQAGMEVDFGGFGKEYAADRAATELQRAGVESGLVNLGGDIRVVGARPDGRAWQLGIRHPRDAESTAAAIAVSDAALATSGDYERYFDLDGQRYCHILNPLTGWPVSYWQSVSVVAPVCIAAGALSTIAMLKGAAAVEFLQAQNVSYLAIDSRGEVTRENR